MNSYKFLYYPCNRALFNKWQTIKIIEYDKRTIGINMSIGYTQNITVKDIIIMTIIIIIIIKL
jgi:hypothetical protein